MGLNVLIKYLNWEMILNRNDSIFISIIIPIHNEEDSLPQLMAELDEVVIGATYGIEVIIINDVSTDGSQKIIEEFEKKYYYVKSIYLHKKGGQTGCFQVAFQEAKGKYLIRMDGDLQDDPRDLKHFFNLCMDGQDLIMGLRGLRKHRRLLRVVSMLYDALMVLMVDSPLHTSTSSFIAFKTEFIKGIIFKKNDHRYLPLIAINKGATKIREIVVSHREREYGVTKYNNLHKIFFGIIETVSFLIRIKLGYYNSIKSRIKEETK